MPATSASSPVDAAPQAAKPASIARLFRTRSATAPVIGSTITCTTVATDSRYPHSDPAGNSSPNSAMSHRRSASGHARTPLLATSALAAAVATEVR
ncbi:hypothetical protein GCM10027174_31120 [Salinifilum aidingensis]